MLSKFNTQVQLNQTSRVILITLAQFLANSHVFHMHLDANSG